jgi:hypothetical protein
VAVETGRCQPPPHGDLGVGCSSLEICFLRNR